MKLRIENSFTTIEDFLPTELKIVTLVLTYIDAQKEREKQALFMAYNKAMARGYRRKAAFIAAKLATIGECEVCLLQDNKFPTGLLTKVTDALDKALSIPKYEGRVLKYELQDDRAVTLPDQIYRWYNEPPPLRPYQQTCLELALAKNRGTFECAVGSGKTLIAANIIKDLGVKTLFVVPSTALLEQTTNLFSLYFGKDKVQSVSTLQIKNAKKLKPIRIATIQTVASLQKQGLLSYLVDDIDMVMLDEAHHGGANSYINLLPAINHVFYRFNFSGTYTRNDSKIMELWGVCGECLFQYNASDAIKDGYLTPVNFKIVRLKGRSGGMYAEEYTDNYGSKEFLDAIVAQVNSIPADKSILILVDRKEAVGHQIRDWLKVNGIESTYMTGDNNKDDIREAIENFNDKKIRVFIASQILSEGVDIRSTDVLILGRGGKSDIAITQAIGRSVRLYPGKKEAIVIDFEFIEPYEKLYLFKN